MKSMVNIELCKLNCLVASTYTFYVDQYNNEHQYLVYYGYEKNIIRR